jgi:hypothetical protein
MRRLGLPSAKRTVARGVTVCRRKGYTEDQALHLIEAAAQAAWALALDLGAADVTWLAAVHDEAMARHARQALK